MDFPKLRSVVQVPRASESSDGVASNDGFVANPMEAKTNWAWARAPTRFLF